MKARSEYESGVYRTYVVATDEQQHRATVGKNSYRAILSSCRVISRSSDRPVRAVAAVVAALSPVITWEENLRDAEALCRGDRGRQLSALPANIDKARRALYGSAIDALRGLKVWNFYWSILYPDNPLTVCVDRHVARAAMGWELGWRVVDQRLKVTGEYMRVANAVRSEASRLGLLPLELQALLWLVMRENPYQRRMEFG